MMMAYAMSLYLELRANDYTNFIILGMRRKRAYKMIIFEYLIGWLGSFSVGIILGAAAVRGGQHLVKSLYPGLIDITKVSWNVYFSVVKLSVIIMLATFFLLMLWLDDRDLSNMAKKSYSSDKKRSAKLGVYMIAVAAVISYFGYSMFQSHENATCRSICVMVFFRNYSVNIFCPSILSIIKQK